MTTTLKIAAARSKAFILVATGLLLAFAFLPPSRVGAAACAAPGTDFGSVVVSVDVPAAGKYRLWSRIMVPSTASNSYLLEVDGVNCYVVGGKSIASNVWTWVDYQNGDTAAKIDLQLSKGAHSVKFIGRQADIKLDRFIMSSDLSCVPNPASNGDNCNNPLDTTPPSITITAPADGATVSAAANITANASDASGVTKVEFYVNNLKKATVTTAPYGFNWNTADVANDTYTLIAKAYDAAGNVGTDTLQVVVKNKDTQPPTTPANLTATAIAYNKVDLAWQASTDNEDIGGYTVVRNGVPLASVSAVTKYQDTTATANTTYNYQVVAYDGAGNASELSGAISVTTPNILDTQAPTAPAGLTATAAGYAQVNLKWKPSTDNVGVTKYSIYRQTAGGSPELAGEAAGTTFGDGGLSQSTQYAYYVVAKDGAGNTSAPSAKSAVTTPTQKPKGVIKGRVFSGKNNKPAVAKVTITINGKKHTYTTNRKGEYEIRNLIPGTYTITYSKSIYFSQSLTVKVKSNTVTREVTLKLR